MIQPYEGEVLTSVGVRELKISITSAYGLDKEPDDIKLDWFCRNEDVLHLRQRNAKEPYTFQALLRAWKQYKKDPTDEIKIFVEKD